MERKATVVDGLSTVRRRQCALSEGVAVGEEVKVNLGHLDQVTGEPHGFDTEIPLTGAGLADERRALHLAAKSCRSTDGGSTGHLTHKWRAGIFRLQPRRLRLSGWSIDAHRQRLVPSRSGGNSGVLNGERITYHDSSGRAGTAYAG